MRAAAAALFATGDAGYRAAGDAANRAVDVPRDGKGRACYGVLGDISIALGCAADESVLATDAVFAVLAPAVGVAVEHVPATRL